MEKLSEKLSEMKLYQLERSKDKDALEAEIKQLEEQFSALGDNSARLAVALEEQSISVIFLYFFRVALCVFHRRLYLRLVLFQKRYDTWKMRRTQYRK